MNRFKLAVTAAAITEVAFLAAFVLLADFSQRLHVLLFVSTIAVYTIVAFALIALGAWLRTNVRLSA